MSTGRDLRNKIICYNEEIYTVGGNKAHSAEKFNFSNKQWSPLKNYSSLVRDPLDSWYCAMIDENPLKNATSKGSLFRICDKLSAYENRASLPLHYEPDYEENSDELELNNYVPSNLNVPPYRHIQFNQYGYEDEMSARSDIASGEEEELDYH